MPPPQTPPQTPPPQTTPPEVDLTLRTFGQQPIPVIDPESEPDHQIRLMVERRKSKQAAAAIPAGSEVVEEGTPAAPSSDADRKDPDVGDLLADALRFRKAPKKAAKPAVDPADPADPPAAAPAKDVVAPPPPEPKVTVRRRQPQSQPQVNPATIAAQAAEAATKAVAGMLKPAAQPSSPDTSELTQEEQADFEVVQFMAKEDPKYAGADAEFLENAKRTAKYVTKWEAQNPGKSYDPDDTEHNEFFSTLRMRYTARDLDRWQSRMIARQEAERFEKSRKQETADKLKDVEARATRADLAPKVSGTVQAAARAIAQEFGADVVATLHSGGPEKLAQERPEIDEALRTAVAEVAPLIEVIVHLDDPNGPEFNKNNETHRNYAQFLAAKEAEYYGAEDNQGRTLVTRTEYVSMSQAQRSQHWYITTDNIIAELVDTVAKRHKAAVDRDVERARKTAERLGYVKPPSQPTESKSSAITQTPPLAAVKPVSPPASGGVMTGASDQSPSGGVAAVYDKAHAVLFGRR